MKDLKFIQVKWLHCPGFENSYEVSNYGQVRSIDRYCSGRKGLIKGQIIHSDLNQKGYPQLRLYNSNKKYVRNQHRLVALAFIDNPEGLIEVNHIDHNKHNNHVDNLEWITRSDNIKHSYIHRDPKTYKGSGNKNAKLTEEQVKNIRKEYKNNKITYKELAYKNNVGVTLIGYIVNNKIWKHV